MEKAGRISGFAQFHGNLFRSERRFEVSLRCLGRHQVGVVEQRIGQGLQPGLRALQGQEQAAGVAAKLGASRAVVMRGMPKASNIRSMPRPNPNAKRPPVRRCMVVAQLAVTTG